MFVIALMTLLMKASNRAKNLVTAFFGADLRFIPTYSAKASAAFSSSNSSAADLASPKCFERFFASASESIPRDRSIPIIAWKYSWYAVFSDAVRSLIAVASV